MSDSDISQIIKTFDRYFTILENPNVGKQVTIDNVAQAFDCCLFVEAAVAKARAEGKTEILDNYLHCVWKRKNRSNMYKCSMLQTACDKMLEVYMKDSAVSTLVVDKLINLYIRYCGKDRLNNFLKDFLTNSMCSNVIVESLIELGVSYTHIENEALLALWEDQIGNGRRDEVSSCIDKMLDDYCIVELVKFASDLENTSETKRLIVQRLTSKTIQNDVSLFLAFVQINATLLLNLINDYPEFRISFVDGIFYFGRNMKRTDENWSYDHKFKYEHLLRFMKILLDGPDEVYELTNYRLQLAKTQPDGAIWNDVEKHCL